MKLLDSDPVLKAKLGSMGGIDNVLSPSMLSGIPRLRSYPANAPPPASSPNRPGSVPDGPQGSAASEKPLNPSELFQTLRGKAELNPELVRRKLSDTCLMKEHFSSLVQLAQIASYQDPELSSIAIEVARSLLPLFDSLQQRAGSFRTLIMTARQIDGEVDLTDASRAT